MDARSRMTTDVYTIEPTTNLDEAWEFMVAMDVRHLPVVDGERLVGILSDRDVLLRAVNCKGQVIVPRLPVYEVMTRDVVTCQATSSVADLARVMIDRKIDSVPVMKGKILVGLITSSDLMEVLCAATPAAAHQVIPIDFRLKRHRPVFSSPAAMAAGHA